MSKAEELANELNDELKKRVSHVVFLPASLAAASETELRRLAQVEAEHAALLKAISDAEPVACSHFTDEQISRSMNGTGLWVYATRGEPLYTLNGIKKP